MKTLQILLFCCLFLGCNNPNNVSVVSKLDLICLPIIDNFFKKVESNNYKVAIDELLLSNKNIDTKDSATVAMKDRFYAINQYSGIYRGKSLLKKKVVNDDIAIYSYLAKYDKKFYRFIFVFYNNGAATRIYKFSFDDTVDIEIEESLKLYM